MFFSLTTKNRSYGVWVWISSQGLVLWHCCCSVPRPEMQPGFSWYFHLPESGLCWPLGIAWIASFQVKTELMKPSNAAWKTKLKKSNLFIFNFFFEVLSTNLFLSGRDDRKFVCSPKSNIRDFMSLGVLFILFLSRENPKYPKWPEEVTEWAHTHWEEEAETGFQQT